MLALTALLITACGTAPQTLTVRPAPEPTLHKRIIVPSPTPAPRPAKRTARSRISARIRSRTARSARRSLSLATPPAWTHVGSMISSRVLDHSWT